jgi:hypothetical protein
MHIDFLHFCTRDTAIILTIDILAKALVLLSI